MDISLHAKERYAQRIMDKDDKTDVAVYINNHNEDIEVAIGKMIEYGELIYTGVSTSKYNNSIVDVYLKDTWVVIVDNKKNKVITLYSIDLGVGKEFNEMYMSKLLDRLNIARKSYNEQCGAIESQIAGYDVLISENNGIITDYKKTIKSLEEQNKMYQEIKESLNTNKQIAEKDVRDTVAILTGRKVF